MGYNSAILGNAILDIALFVIFKDGGGGGGGYVLGPVRVIA